MTIVLFVGIVLDAFCLLELAAAVWGACGFADAERGARLSRVPSDAISQLLPEFLLITLYGILVFLEFVYVSSYGRFFSIFSTS